MLLIIVAFSLLKLSLGKYSVRPDMYHGYNEDRSVHVSGHMGPVRIIPIAAGAYHSPYHVINHEAPVYNVEPAPTAVHHPAPVAPYHVDQPVGIPAYQEPAMHRAHYPIHPNDVQEQVELVESPSTRREDRNIALNLDFVPFEINVPMLSLSMKDPVKKPTVTRRKQRYDSKRDSHTVKFNMDIGDFDADVETNFHSTVTKRKQQRNDSKRESRTVKFDLDIDNLDVDVETNFHSDLALNKFNDLEEIEFLVV